MSATSSVGLSIEDLRQLVKKDLAASNELQDRIDAIRSTIAAGSAPPREEIGALGVEHKEIGRDLVHRIDQIEAQKDLTASDRNMLQALTARLGVHDLQSARIAELGDLIAAPDAWLKSDEVRQSTKPEDSTEIVAKASTSSLDLARNYDAVDDNGGDDDVDDGGDADGYSIEAQHDSDPEDIDKSSWPLLYQILDIDPTTPEDVFDEHLEYRYRALALKHEPHNVPNDPTAPERWTAINKAYAMLSDANRRRFYNTHGNVPKDLRDFDLAQLRIEG